MTDERGIKIIVLDEIHHLVIGDADKISTVVAECIKRAAIENAASSIVLVGRPFPSGDPA